MTQTFATSGQRLQRLAHARLVVSGLERFVKGGGTDRNGMVERAPDYSDYLGGFRGRVRSGYMSKARGRGRAAVIDS